MVACVFDIAYGYLMHALLLLFLTHQSAEVFIIERQWENKETQHSKSILLSLNALHPAGCLHVRSKFYGMNLLHYIHRKHLQLEA